jgi:PAS domain S-box-containing protein
MTDYETPSSEERLRDLLATLELGTVMARDFDGVIRFWSAGCVRLYGWSAAEAIGKNSHVLLKTVFPVPLAEIEAALLTSESGWATCATRKRTARRLSSPREKFCGATRADNRVR